MQELYDLFLNSSGVCTDSRNVKNGNVFFALKGVSFDGNKFALKAIESGAFIAVVDDPKLKNADKCFFVDDVLIALTEIAKIHRANLKCPVLAITGSNGKTTTKELVASVLSRKFNLNFTKGNYNNHIGVPLTILDTPLNAEFLIVEMGANHIGEIDFLCKIANPDYGIITNIGKAHLEGFGSPHGVFVAKTELYKHIANFGKGLIVNANDKLLMSATDNNVLCSYGSSDANVIGQISKLNPYLHLNCNIDNNSFQIETNLFGSYNANNVLVALAVGKYFGVPENEMKLAIQDYVPTNNRSQTINTAKKNSIILDAYNANPSSMKLALQDFANVESDKKLAIVGSMFELGEYSKEEHLAIIKLIKELNLENTLFFGNEFFEFSSNFPEFPFFNVQEDIVNHLLKMDYHNCYIIIKGSRGVALEKLVEYL